jgi:hypothetical protein
MFRGLKGRRVVANVATGEAFRGTVVALSWWHLTLQGVEVAEVGSAGPVPAEGAFRIARRSVTWIQEIV